MTLTVYALGLNLVAAESPAEAVAVMGRYEEPGRWSVADVTELTADELAEPVDDSAATTVAQALAQIPAGPRAPRESPGILIRWDYPGA